MQIKNSLISTIMTASDKYKFMLKRFGEHATNYYLDNTPDINNAFKMALYAEYVCDEAIERIKQRLRRK